MAVSARGKVSKLYPQKNGCYLRLDAGTKPKNGYFWISLNHPNYNSLYSLAVVAYVNKYPLEVRAESDIKPTEHATVSYVTLYK